MKAITIWQSKLKSIAELAVTTGRKPSNLSRTLKTMAHYGRVDMQPAGGRQLRPVAKATEFRILV